MVKSSFANLPGIHKHSLIEAFVAKLEVETEKGGYF